AAQMLGAAEHRSERIVLGSPRCGCGGGDEERRPQQRRWAAWTPKIRRGAPAGIARSLGRDSEAQPFICEVGVLQAGPGVEDLVQAVADAAHDLVTLVELGSKALAA